MTEYIGIHKQWKLKRLVDELRKRTDHSEYGSPDAQVNSIHDYLEDQNKWKDAHAKGLVPDTRVELLGLLYQRQGALAVLEDDVDGWNKLALGTLYRLRAAQFNFVRCDREFARTQNQTGHLDAFAQTLAQLYSLRWLDQAHDFGRWLVDGTLAGYCYDAKPMFRNCAPWFFLNLYADRANLKVEHWPEHPFPAPEYDRLLACWRTTDEAELAGALLAACDRHTHECFGRSTSESKQQDFSLDTVMGWPIEVHMIVRLREALGLPNPELDHPLMHIGLASPPPAIPIRSDELLDAVTEKVCRIYPELYDHL